MATPGALYVVIFGLILIIHSFSVKLLKKVGKTLDVGQISRISKASTPLTSYTLWKLCWAGTTSKFFVPNSGESGKTDVIWPTILSVGTTLESGKKDPN